MLPVSLAFFLVSLKSGRLATRFGARLIMTWGLALMGLGLLALSTLSRAADIVLIEFAFLSYVLFSTESDLDLLGNLISRAGFAARLVAERSILIESMIIYELRVQEANALGTAYLRADTIAEPQRGELKAALREYTADRVRLLSGKERDQIELLLAKVSGLHGRMWRSAIKATQDNAPLMAVVLPPINEVIDLHSMHLAMARRHLPLAIMAMLLGTAAIGVGLLGFGNGRAGRRFSLLDSVYGTALVLALFMTIDMDYPGIGFIRVSNRSVVEALAAMN